MIFMHRLSIGFIVLLFILLTTCKKDQQPEPTSNQQFVTKPATIFDSGSVILVGQINEIPQGLEEYGFLVSPNADLSSADKIKITSPAAIGQFTSNVYSYLQKNRTYYVAVYSIHNGGTLKMYNTVSFNTSNGLKIIVNSILPTKADIGDTVIFRGKYFLSQPLNIFFDNSSATTIIQNDSTLKCIVPSLLKTSIPVITIKNANKADTLANSFSLNNPTISDFTPIATFRDTVTINGDHLEKQTH
jgi:hypothetical protein